MMDTEEKIALPEIEQDTNKYKKHINELIEDAEIEAEMEAEKKIRSKNSRVFSISMISLVLLALIYFQINSPSKPETTPEKEDTTVLKVPMESAEEKLAKEVPVLENENVQIPFKNSKSLMSMVKPAKITFAEKTGPSEKPNLSNLSLKKNKKPSQTAGFSINRKKPASTKDNTRFFVQTGAFSQKKNAEASMKKIQSKGFSPFIHVLNLGNTKTYLVQLGVFPNMEKAKLVQEKLARAGYAKTIIK